MKNRLLKALKYKALKYAIIFLIIPAVILFDALLFKGKRYMAASVVTAALGCVPFFIVFEKRKYAARELAVIAVMSAISVAGRVIFAPIPGFKPVAAIVIITGACFGAEAGFITGGISALASNAFFGQGPWTPFQMFSWGIIGFFAGVIFYGKNFKNKGVSFVFIILYGVLSGPAFSLLMDVYTVISVSGAFLWREYLAFCLSALPFTLEYALSNALFLAVLIIPLTLAADRLKTKYGVFSPVPNIGGGESVKNGNE